jgi:TP901 family phage tail tape measure protein
MDQNVKVRVQGEGVDGFAGSMDNAIGSLMSFKGAVGAVGGALAALSAGALAKATGAARSFETAMVEVEKVTNPQTAATMSSEIRNMAETIPLTQEKLAGLTADAARFGIRGTENLRSFSESVAKMATATDLSTEKAGQSLAKLSELTNTPVSEIENLGSVINELSNTAATSSSEVTDSMLRSSAALSQLGLEQTQIAAMSASLNEVSASSRRAGTRLRRVAQQLMNPQKVEKLAGALGMTSEEFTNMREESPDELLMQMVTAFEEGGAAADALRTSLSTSSRQAIAGLAQNTEGLNQALDTANTQFAEATSLQSEFDSATNTLDAKLQLLQNSLRNQSIEIGNVLLPYLTDLVTVFTDLVTEGDGLLGFLDATEKAFGLVGATIAGTAAALTVLVSGPVGLAVAALGTLATAFATNFGGIRDTVSESLGAVREEFAGVLDTAEYRVRSTLTTLRTAWKAHGGEVVGSVTEYLTTVRQGFETALDLVTDAIVEPILDDLLAVYGTHLGRLAGETLRTLDAVLGYYQTAAALIADLWAEWGDEITAVTEVVGEYLSASLGTSLDALLSTVRVALAVLRGDFRGAFEIITGFSERYSERVREIFESVPMFSGLVSGTQEAQGAVSRFAGAFIGSVERVAASARTAFETVRGVIVPVVRFLADNLIIPYLNRIEAVWNRHGDALIRETVATFRHIQSVISDVIGFLAPYVRTALSLVVGAFKLAFGVLETVVDAGLTVLGGLWDVFGEEILGTVEFAFDAIVGVAGVSLDLLLTTIRTVLALVRGDWRQAFTLISEFFIRTFRGLVEFVAEWGDRFVDGLTSAISDATDAAEDLIDDFVAYVTDALEGVAEGIGEATRTALNDALGLPYDYSIGPVEVEGETVVPEQSLSIPALAEGGVVTSPTLAMVGEGGENEVVAPLSKLDQLAPRGAASPREVVVRFEGEGSLVETVRREATVVVQDEFEGRQRTVRRLGARGGRS